MVFHMSKPSMSGTIMEMVEMMNLSIDLIFALSPLTIIEIFHNAWGHFCELLCKYRNVKSKLYAERYWHHLIIWRKDLINDAT